MGPMNSFLQINCFSRPRLIYYYRRLILGGFIDDMGPPPPGILYESIHPVLELNDAEKQTSNNSINENVKMSRDRAK